LLLRDSGSIITPIGQYFVELAFDEQTIISAELDLAVIDKKKMTFDLYVNQE